MSDFEHPPYADDIVAPGPIELLPEGDADARRRRPGRTAIAATLAVLLVLVAGGAAYGWSVLQRPEVQLARAFDATKSTAQGTMTVTVQGGAKAGTGSSLRYSWAPGTQQFAVVHDGAKAATVTTTDTHLTVQLVPSSLPGTSSSDQLGGLAGGLGSLGGLGALATLGGAGDVLTALLDGKPVGIAIGPGSALQKALDKAAASGGSASTEVSPAQVGKILDSVTAAVKDNTTVTEVGTDTDGTHYVATVSMKKVVDEAWKDVAAAIPGGGAGLKPDLSELEKATLSVDVWVKDGDVSRVEIPVPQGMGGQGAGARVVVVMSGDGVQPVDGPVTEVPESLVELLTGNG